MKAFEYRKFGLENLVLVERDTPHAAAHEVRLALLKNEETLEIDVGDDGHGFETEQWGEAGVRPGHFGLLGMRERVAFLGGLCKVQSKPGEGTTVRIVVPRERLR